MLLVKAVWISLLSTFPHSVLMKTTDCSHSSNSPTHVNLLIFDVTYPGWLVSSLRNVCLVGSDCRAKLLQVDVNKRATIMKKTLQSAKAILRWLDLRTSYKMYLCVRYRTCLTRVERSEVFLLNFPHFLCSKTRCVFVLSSAQCGQKGNKEAYPR